MLDNIMRQKLSINKIYKSLGLDDNGKEGEAKMEDKDKLNKLEEPEKLSDPKQEEDEKKEPEKMAEPAPEDKSDSEKDKNKDEDEKMSEPEEGMACKFSEIDGWTNKAKAVSFEASKGKKEKKSIWSFSAPIAPSQDEPKNVWERLKINI